MIELIGPAFAITMLGSIESLLSAVIVDRATGTRHDSNQELVGQGIANVVSPLFGGFAVTGALARTATNMRNGATSPVSGIVHSLVLVLIILLCAPLAVHVPLAVGVEPPASNVAVYSVDGPFFFGAVENFERALQSAPSGPGTIIIIRLRWVPFIDITGLQALEGAIIELHKRNLRVMLSGANARVRGKLRRAGIQFYLARPPVRQPGPSSSLGGLPFHADIWLLAAPRESGSSMATLLYYVSLCDTVGRDQEVPPQRAGALFLHRLEGRHPDEARSASAFATWPAGCCDER